MLIPNMGIKYNNSEIFDQFFDKNDWCLLRFTVSQRVSIHNIENTKGYLKNRRTKHKLVCIHFDTFSMLIPNMGTIFNNSELLKNVLNKNDGVIYTPQPHRELKYRIQHVCDSTTLKTSNATSRTTGPNIGLFALILMHIIC